MLMEQQWSERLRWKEACSQQIRELMGMASRPVEDRVAAKQYEEHKKQAMEENSSRSKPKSRGGTIHLTSRIEIEQVVCEIRKGDAEQRELFNALLDCKYLHLYTRMGMELVAYRYCLAWRADSNRQHEEIINAIRATANEQVPYNIQGVRTVTPAWLHYAVNVSFNSISMSSPRFSASKFVCSCMKLASCMRNERVYSSAYFFLLTTDSL